MQSLDSMNKNCVGRRGAPGKLASDSEGLEGSKRLYVNAARIRGKLSCLIRGDLSILRERQRSAEAIVVGGITTTRGGQGNLTTGRRAERFGSWAEGRGAEAVAGSTGMRHGSTRTPATSSYSTEPPDADPHVRWCGRGAARPSPYPNCLSDSRCTYPGRTGRVRRGYMVGHMPSVLPPPGKGGASRP